jgi:cobaltochelatase CobT
VTIVDVEQLGGAMTEQLAALFEEEPRQVGRAAGFLMEPLPSVVGPPAALGRAAKPVRSTGGMAGAAGSPAA